MASIYDIKPLFQNLLRPWVTWLVEKNISPNQVTFATFCFSLLYALLLAIFITSSFVLCLFPLVLFIRMALNAIDGMLAKEHNQKTPLGALLNELTDMVADAALYLPFALHPDVNAYLIIFIVVLSVVSEAAGIAGVLINASRRYDGPMGKSDRAFTFSLISLWLAFFPVNQWLNWVLLIVLLLIITTIVNRCYRALNEIGNQHVA